MRRYCNHANDSLAYKRPFYPPSPKHTPILVRSTTYAGEAGHPLTPKRSIVVPVSLLPLTNTSSKAQEEALHNVKVLAGSRWTVDPSKDAGLPSWRHEPVYASDSSTVATGLEAHIPAGSSNASDIGRHGYIKISCELFPETQMNLKWCMDALRTLVREANVSTPYVQLYDNSRNSGSSNRRWVVHRRASPDQAYGQSTSFAWTWRWESQGRAEKSDYQGFP